MSSICGAVYVNDLSISKSNITLMMDSLSIHPYDESLVLQEKNIFMGCNMQYITPESKYEVLPRKEHVTGLSITADAIIDNREELFSHLSIPYEERNLITDSDLILSAYKKWGNHCPKYITGDYSFAIWNHHKQELFCARDHVGKRTFYYYYDKNSFIFSTLMKPIIAFINKKITLNERWIADYLGLFGVIHELECNDTIYEDIFQLPPATTLTFNCNGLKIEKYWNPLDLKPLKLKTDEEYTHAFLDVFSKAVKSKLRTDGKVGIFMSGGLDSSSVGALAAKELSKKNNELKAYHALPLKNYNNSLPKNWICDESEYINELVHMYPNINVDYVRSENKNSYKDIDYFTKTLEHPFKPVVNFYWINDIFERASKDNCKVILDGQYGNFSISYGNYITNIYELLKRGRLYSIYKEINSYSKILNVNRNYVAKRTLKSFIPSNLFHKTTVIDDNFSIINTDLEKKWNVTERINTAFNSKNIFDIESIKEMRSFYTNPSFFSHLGSIETKMSLSNGVVNRDPTRDKNVIEFCSRIPFDQFVRDGRERFLIRKSMAGILPAKIINNYTSRGKQGADWVQRLIPLWPEIMQNFQHMLDDSIIQSYINIHKLNKMLSDIKNMEHKELRNEGSLKVKSLFICYVFYKYIKELSA